MAITFFISNSYSSDVDTILEGLNKYQESYNKLPRFALTYRHISEKPTQTKEEANRIAIQQIQFSSSFFPEEYAPNVDKFIEKIDFDGTVNQIMQGSVLEQTIEVIFRFNDFEHTIVNSDGSLLINQKYDHNQARLSVFDSNLSKDNLYVDKALLNDRNPKQNIQFLFNWYFIFVIDGVLSAEQLDENRFRITKQGEGVQLVLDVEKKEDYFVPTKFVIDQENSCRESNSYKNYVNQSGLWVPSLIVEDIIPQESATGLAGLLGPTRLLYSLE